MISRIRLLFSNNTFFTILISALSLIIIVSIIVLFNVSNSLGAVNSNKDTAYQKYIEVVKQMQDKNTKALEKVVSLGFTNDQVERIVENNSRYSLVINSKTIDKKTTIVYSNTPGISVLLFENYSAKLLNLVPKVIIDKGSLIKKGSINSLVKVSTSKAKFKTKISGTDSSKMIAYSFTKVKAGEIITYEFDQDFAKKIGLKTNVIEVIYNRTKG